MLHDWEQLAMYDVGIGGDSYGASDGLVVSMPDC